MKNEFYNEFDCEFLRPTKTDYRTPFQQDRDRIIYSSSFRRLQAKTQVFFSGEYDFYRTRLTHSIEVGQIGRSICNYLEQSYEDFSRTFKVDPDLVEAACLAHDIGHPPFGHAGESKLHELMRGYGGFEGNAQTLRILTETIYSSKGKRKGMKPTRALLDGVLKYKSLHGQLDKPNKHFIYDNQKPYLDFVFKGVDIAATVQPGKELNNFRSIECQIMDWADDTAYSLNDLTDGMRAGFITVANIEAWGARNDITGKEAELLEHIVETIDDEEVGRLLSLKVGEFVGACSVQERSNVMSDLTNRYRYELVIDPAVRSLANLLKQLSIDLVFKSTQLKQLEYKCNNLLGQMFGALTDNYLNDACVRTLLPEDIGGSILEQQHEADRVRLICDYIAGMTDGFAIRTFKRLFAPDFGSIVDLV